jgi:Ni/Co efflux regulator RcnB
MRAFLTFYAILALVIPTVAFAQPQDSGSSRAIGNESAVQAGGIRATPIAARVVRRGPRRRVRTFVYRGRTVDVFRGPRFVYPRGFAYRRWRAGQLLPLALIATPYFFLEYDRLGLGVPPPGYRWVRYGPDLVRVNVRTREIEDVAYDAIDDDEG